MTSKRRSKRQPLNKWDVSNVTDMKRMFDGAESFNQPLNKWNVSNVTYMNRMFDGARRLFRLTTTSRRHLFIE